MLRAGSLLALALFLACDDGDDDTVPVIDAAPLDAPALDATGSDAAPVDAGSPDAAPAPFTMSGEINLTRDTLTPERTCSEAPQFAVTALAADSATVAAAPVDDCLVAGDEVLLINLQGTPEASAEVGNWELLRVAAVAGEAVTFTSTLQRSYGEPATQKLALVRVPRYGALTVAEGASVTAAKWDGQTGGVLALRAASIQIDGELSAARIGYRGGRWSQDGEDCTENTQTESGESYTGPPVAQTQANGGGAGGVAPADGPWYNANSPITPSSAHATDGEPGKNDNGRTLGEIGKAYGAPGGARLTLGSGAPGNLTCIPGNVVPILSPVPNDHRGGGIVIVLSGPIHVGATGRITATPVDQSRDTASAGGYVYLRGSEVDVGDEQVTARGSQGLAVNGPVAGMFNQGGVGYVAIQTGAPVVGTTSPAATVVAP